MRNICEQLLIFIHIRCKLGLTKTVDRMYKIKNTFSSFHIDMGKTKLTKHNNNKTKTKKVYIYMQKIITKESFSTWVNWQVVRNYFNDQFSSKESLIGKENFFNFFFRYAQNKRNRIIKKLCKDDANIKRDFALHQFSSMFTTADKIPSFLEFMAVKCFCVCMQSSLLCAWNFAKLSYQDERACERMQKVSHAYTNLFNQMGTV